MSKEVADEVSQIAEGVYLVYGDRPLVHVIFRGLSAQVLVGVAWTPSCRVSRNRLRLLLKRCRYRFPLREWSAVCYFAPSATQVYESLADRLTSRGYTW